MSKVSSSKFLTLLATVTCFACGGIPASTNQSVNTTNTNQQIANTNGNNKQPITDANSTAKSENTPNNSSSPTYSVEWTSKQIPAEMTAGKEQSVKVTLKNTSGSTWAEKDIFVSYHWFQSDKMVDKYDGIRSKLPQDVAPNAEVTIDDVRILTPKSPGTYQLQLTLVNENVAWFEAKGAKTLTVPVIVR